MIIGQHTGYVLDSSVLAKWFLHEGERNRKRALALRDLHVTHRSTIFVPQLAIFEILSAIGTSAKASEEDGQIALEALHDLHLEMKIPDPDLLRKANAIAWAYKISIYDALYVALAEQLGYPLITADETMIRKMKGHSIVVALRDVEI